MTKTKSVHGVAALVKECMTAQLAVSATALALSLLRKMRMTVMTLTNWPFPTFPPTPWTAKQIKEYAQQQRAQTEDALL
jgi:hypothetical protein